MRKIFKCTIKLTEKIFFSSLCNNNMGSSIYDFHMEGERVDPKWTGVGTGGGGGVMA